MTAIAKPSLFTRESFSWNIITDAIAENKMIPTFKTGYTNAPSLLKLDKPLTKK